MPLMYYQAEPDQSAAKALGWFNSIMSTGNALRAAKDQKLASSALFGAPGEGLGNLTKQHAPGLDQNLAGPALAMTQGGMATPGVMNGASWRGLNAQQRGAVTNMFTGGGFGGGGMMQMALARALMGGG